MFFLLQFSIWSNNHCQYNSIGPDDFLILVLISGGIGFMTKDFGRGSLATPWYLIAIFETKDLSQVFVKSGSLNIIPYIPKTLLFHLYEPIDCLMKTRYYLKGKLLFEKKTLNVHCTWALPVGGVWTVAWMVYCTYLSTFKLTISCFRGCQKACALRTWPATVRIWCQQGFKFRLMFFKLKLTLWIMFSKRICHVFSSVVIYALKEMVLSQLVDN